jgi:cytochrome oxidase Cu insertion factor (SCO1/SenC/PrrC family)
VVAAAGAVLVAVLLVGLPRLQPPTGTLLVAVSGHAAGALPSTPIALHGQGGWSALGNASGAVPVAPDEREVLAVAVVAGSYDGMRLGSDQATLAITVAAGQVEPVLLGVDGGRLVTSAAYAGNDEVNLGLGELSGKFVAMPPFALVDQLGHTFDNQAVAGTDLVVAAFHTSCHQTCPLYTALFFQIEKQLPPGVRLAEVTTDPVTDTQTVLDDYAHRIGAPWTFATGPADALTAFWKPFGVELASGDSHVSTLAVIDRHGYVRLVYRGVPAVGSSMPPNLITDLGTEGLHELASGGDGWGAPEVLRALLTIAGPEQPSPSAGGRAPAFDLPTTDGRKVSLSDLTGRPLVINFWASYCPPCRAEMPLLQQQVGAAQRVQLVLINEGDGAQAARDFLAAVGVRQPSLLDADLRVGRAYGVSALPATVFVRADGSIASRQLGQLDERVLAARLSNLVTQ